MKYNLILNQDPIMKSLTEKYGELTLTKSNDYFDDLINAIIGQLLSNKAAATIYKRIAKLCNDSSSQEPRRILNSAATAEADFRGVTPENILAVSEESLRAAGSSYGKLRCMKALAQAVIEKTVDLESIDKYEDDEVIRQLTVIKGIGRWTAEMFLIFSLAREDIFSAGDGGLSSALNRLYGNGAALSKPEIRSITEKWHPYRSYASLYLWRSLDNK